MGEKWDLGMAKVRKNVYICIMAELNSSIQYLQGVGPKRAELIASELGVATLSDLIHCYPYRYIDRSRIINISEINSTAMAVQIRAKVVKATLFGAQSSILARRTLSLEGEPQEEIFDVRELSGGQVASSGSHSQPRSNLAKRLSVIVEDSSGRIEVVFFKGIKWNYSIMIPGSEFVFFGKPQEYNNTYNIVHPEVDRVQASVVPQGVMTGVYPSTERLKNAGITGKVMCKMISSALSLSLAEIQETLPSYLIENLGLCSLAYALKNIHFPKDAPSLERAQRRLKFEELFFLQLSLLKQKYIRSRSTLGLCLNKVGPDFHACYNALPYKLTGAQQRVIKEIHTDMKSGMQMNRLVQGDVGSGKTMVALLSCLIAHGNGCQACIMAPTEVLARQHIANVSKYLAPTNVKAAILTGSTGAKERREIHEGLLDGSISIIVGTHALIEEPVQFRCLALAVIDEQHRFGVEQRAKLWSKGPIIDSKRYSPHVLVMTATPIPRTLAMTLYGDLDVSVIDEMPPGRRPVTTTCISGGRTNALYKFMKREIASGRQVFVVYPMIFDSEKTDMQNLEKGYEDIVEAFPLSQGYKIAIVHGKQSAAEKEFNMSAFAAGRAHILVATTVIEVGVDVPNASVMVIQSAQRFGLSQLHQLRGRVGRGSQESYCILVKDPKTSKEAQERLDLMCSTENGFEIAEADMRLRGPGDLEGTQQSGLPIDLKIASLSRDGRLLEEARRVASNVLASDPSLQEERNALLLKELRKDKYNLKDFSNIS